MNLLMKTKRSATTFLGDDNNFEMFGSQVELQLTDS